ncbi:hypothetical protein ACFL6N_00835 [Thermodesulfobacteriota bacterium]
MKHAVPFSRQVRNLLTIFGLLTFLVLFALTFFYQVEEIKDEVAESMKTTAQICIELTNDHIRRYNPQINRMINALPVGDDDSTIQYLQANIPMLEPEEFYYVLNDRKRVIFTNHQDIAIYDLDFSRLEQVRGDEPISMVHQSLFNQLPVLTLKFPLPGNSLLLIERSLSGFTNILEHIHMPRFKDNGFFSFYRVMEASSIIRIKNSSTLATTWALS